MDLSETLDFMKDIEVYESDTPECITLIQKNRWMIGKHLEDAKNDAITSPQDKDRVLMRCAKAKEWHTEIESIRKKAIEPQRKWISMVNEAAKSLTEMLNDIQEYSKAHLAAWQNKQLEKSEKAREDLSKFKESLGIDIDMVLSEPCTNISNEHMSVVTTKKWVFEVTDESLIPREYLTIDEKKVSEAMAAGLRDIPGIKMSQEQKIQLRRK